MWKIAEGNILEADIQALVNTVNTVGVMGKGIALQFKKAFPEMFEAYEAVCKAKKLQLGQMHVYDRGSMLNPRYIINFPTKGHWKGKSKIADIEGGPGRPRRRIESSVASRPSPSPRSAAGTAVSTGPTSAR